MSEITPRLNIRLAVISCLAWAVLLVLLWLGTKGLDDQWGPAIFLGRFHILIVHVPIGLLTAALVMELLAFTKWFPKLGEQVMPLLWIGAVGGIGATVAGYLLMAGEQIAGKDMRWHMWTGFAVVVMSFAVIILKLFPGRFPSIAYLGLLAATVIVTGASSHYGGNMVHDNDYLSEYAPDPLKPLLGHPAEKEKEDKSAVAIEKWLIYDDIIQPIFDAKCTECHDENKIEGGLRMDTFEWLVKGGDLMTDEVIDAEFIPGNAEDSEVYYRVVIDPSEEDFMPPGKHEHMTGDEIELLGWWINEGASPEMTVGEAKVDDAIRAILDQVKSASILETS